MAIFFLQIFYALFSILILLIFLWLKINFKMGPKFKMDVKRLLLFKKCKFNYFVKLLLY
jgi:hypothetical protein